jgi:hypothetical protein
MSRMFSSTFIYNKPLSSQEANSIISIHNNKPDFRIRDVILRLFVRLSKTYLRRNSRKIVTRSIIYQRRKTNRGRAARASKISFLSARSCRSLWNRLANKSQVCLCLKISHSSSPALSIPLCLKHHHSRGHRQDVQPRPSPATTTTATTTTMTT